MPCCGGTHEPDAFHCHGCGNCCTVLRGRWRDQRGRFQAVPGTALLRLGTPGGLRMFAWETDPFPQDRLQPLIAVADARTGRLVAFAYELDEDRCPMWDDGCTIYGDRPMVCRSYPLLAVEGEAGPEVALSTLCPALVPVVAAAKAARKPEAVLARAYPHETAAALAIPLLVRSLADVVDYLASADVIDPVKGLSDDELDVWAARGALNAAHVASAAGVLTVEDLRERARRVVRRLEERWLPAPDGGGKT